MLEGLKFGYSFTVPYQIGDPVVPVLFPGTAVSVLHPCSRDRASVRVKFRCPCDIGLRTVWEALQGRFGGPNGL